MVSKAVRHIAVTGAGGYIGRHVVCWLLDNVRADICAVDVRDGAVDARARRMTVDILDDETGASAYERLGRPDAIVHLAWRDGFVHGSARHLQDLPRHYRFLTSAIEAGCSNVTVMGSMHEVGYYIGGIDDVNPPPCEPLSLYGTAKNALRQAMMAFVRGKPVALKWLRGYYITGDDQHASSIFAKIRKFEQEGRKTFPFTDGRSRYDFIDVDALAEQIGVAAVSVDETQIINVCSGEPVALRDKVEDFIRSHALKIRPEYGAFPIRAYDSPEVFGLNRKILEYVSSYKAQR